MAGDDITDEVEDMDGDDIVELTDDEGNSVEFVVLLVVEFEGVEYAALTPVDQLEDEENEEQDIYLFIYEVFEEDEGIVQSFSPIDDEETFEKVREFCSQQIEVLAGS